MMLLGGAFVRPQDAAESPNPRPLPFQNKLPGTARGVLFLRAPMRRPLPATKRPRGMARAMYVLLARELALSDRIRGGRRIPKQARLIGHSEYEAGS